MGLEVEARGGIVEALCGDGVDVALSQDDVVASADLDFVTILRVEQHPIVELHRTHRGASRYHEAPREPFADLRRCRNQDAAARLAVALGPFELDQDAIAHHLDGQLALRFALGLGCCFVVGHEPTVPCPAMTADHDDAPERLALTTTDGLRLRAEWRPASIEASLPTAVLCHPHPLHGGNMHASVIDRLFHALPVIGVPTLRFNFRGVQGSDGRHDHGDRERLDVVSAIEHAIAQRPDAPVRLIGWSFGADLALATAHAAIDAWLAIAPPLRVVDLADMPAGSDERAKHLIIGEQDAFRPPASAAEATATWANTRIDEIQGADHFFGGALDQLAQMASADLQRT